jgi:hypothetical protein
VKIRAVEVGNLKLPAKGGLEASRQFHGLGIIEIQTGHRIIGLRVGGLLFKRCGLSIRIKPDHAITFRVADVVGEYSCAFGALRSASQTRHKVVAVEDIVVQN